MWPDLYEEEKLNNIVRRIVRQAVSADDATSTHHPLPTSTEQDIGYLDKGQELLIDWVGCAGGATWKLVDTRIESA